MTIAVGAFSQRVLSSRALVYDLRTTLADQRRFFIVEIMPARHDAFLRAVDSREDIRLEDFGTILHRGWDEPDDELKADLSLRFGMYADD